MIKQLTKNLKARTARCITEEELRLAWIHELQNTLDLTFHAERGRNDASYNQVIIEFKNKGLFGGKDNSPAFKEAIHDRLKKYILAKAAQEALDPSDYIGIATDGMHVAFAYIKHGNIEHGHLMPLTESVTSLVVQACKDSVRRAVTPENLIEDFGHASTAGAEMMQSLADALMECLDDTRHNKVQMLFEEWRTLYGQVADISDNQTNAILNSVGFDIGATTGRQAGRQAGRQLYKHSCHAVCYTYL